MNRMCGPAKRTRRRLPSSERGSALLIVFVFAAIIAIALYNEMPIAAFEAKRQKEQLLVDRGNEYAHAVRLFYRATKQYPASFEALENTNRIRFLRKRFVDPFTGKDDWRLLHAGPNGILVDSKVVPAANVASGGNAASGFNNTGPGASGMGAFGGNAPGAANTNAVAGNNPFSSNSGGFGSAAGSRTGQAGGGIQGFNQQSGGANSGFSGFFSQPNNPAAESGAEATVPNLPQRAAAVSAAAAPGQAPDPSAPVAGATDTSDANVVSPSYIPRSRNPSSADLVANANGRPAQTDSGATDAFTLPDTVRPQGSATSSGGFNQTGTAGTNVNTGLNTGTGLGTNASGLGANNISNGIQGNTGPSSASNLGRLNSGGLAGVASKAVGVSIKEINNQDNYSLWEFFYDPSKDPMRGALGPQGGGGANTQAAAGGISTTNGQQQTSSPFGGSNQGAGFGNSNSAGLGSSNTSSSGFGNSSSGFGNAGSSSGGGFGSTGSGSGGFGGFNSGYGTRNGSQNTTSSSSAPP